MTDNEVALMQVDNRRPRSSYQQTTQEYGKLNTKGPWQDSVAPNWIQNTHGMTHQEGRYGERLRDKLMTAEKIKREHIEKKAIQDNTVYRTFAANLPGLERNHGSWRTGIMGYKGHNPEWAKDKRFFGTAECGKVHPPYLPRVSGAGGSVVVQPVYTPKGH